jgi:hypothetical protein
LVTKTSELYSVKKIFKSMLVLLAIWWGFSALIAIFKLTGKAGVDCQDKVSTFAGEVLHERNWQLTSDASQFCISYMSETGLFELAHQNRLSAIKEIKNRRDPWGELYDKLSSDRSAVEALVDSLSVIAGERELEGYGLAEMIVSMVQDIPYSFVTTGSCDEYETKGHPCVGEVRLGLYSPYEFLHTEMGDCDTRAVLVYAVLKEFGFDPAIIISDEYAHAMIAINIATAGEYLIYQGKKYYFWETTAKGWLAGMLPPSYNNKNYWKIALAK